MLINLGYLGLPLKRGGGVNPAIAAGYARYKAGTKNLVIAGLGSSTLRGEKSGNGSTNMYVNGWLNKLAADLNTKGERARCDALFGSGRADPTSTELADRDPRVVLTGSWYTDTFLSLGGRRLRAAAAANIAFTPLSIFDRLRVYYQTFTTAGSGTLNVDGGASLGTIDRNTGVDGISPADFSVALAAHTANFSWASGSISPIGFRPFRSDRTEIEILNFGAGSMNICMFQYDPASPNSVEPYRALGAITDMDLFVMQTGRNEWDAGSPVVDMISRMTAYGDKAASMGAAVCIVTMAATTEYVAKGGAAYVQAQRDLAASKGWLLVDGNALFGPYNASAPWQSGDGVHGNDLMHQMYADLFSSVVFRR